MALFITITSMPPLFLYIFPYRKFLSYTACASCLYTKRLLVHIYIQIYNLSAYCQIGRTAGEADGSPCSIQELQGIVTSRSYSRIEPILTLLPLSPRHAGTRNIRLHLNEYSYDSTVNMYHLDHNSTTYTKLN